MDTSWYFRSAPLSAMIGFGASGLMERRENIYMFHWLLLKLEVCCEVPFIQFREPSSLPWWFRRLPCVYFHSYPMCWITCILSNSDLNKWLKSGHTKQVNKYATWASLSDRTVILSHHDDFYLLFSIVLDKTQKVDHFWVLLKTVTRDSNILHGSSFPFFST